ncbi:MAG: hypothetical protein HY097_05030 [Nitrospinae bacterium]|nr:hypothetical protein [Nitrospinota bacterium]MBI3815425.1 hypothetical protein [Nitrospinota bacterium]
MRKIIAAIAAVMILSGVGGLAIAKEKKEPVKVMQVKGEITAVDAKANTFTLKTDKGDITCEIGAGSKITAGKDSKTLADVKAGDKVECKYAMEGEKHICKKLDIKAAK